VADDAVLPPFKMPAYSKPYSHYNWSEFISTDFSDLTWAELTGYLMLVRAFSGVRTRIIWNSFDFKKDGATRGASACAARATSTNIQFAIPR